MLLEVPKPKLPKPKKGLLYLLLSSDGVYKIGCTRNNVKARRTWAIRKTGKDFNIIATKVVKHPFSAETKFIWQMINHVSLIDNSVEFFKLKEDGYSHTDVLEVFGLM